METSASPEKHRRTVKAARVVARVEPDLRSAIMAIASQQQKSTGHVIRELLRRQITGAFVAASTVPAAGDARRPDQ